MQNTFKLILIVPAFMFSFAGNSEEALLQKADSFVEFASQGNLAELRKMDASDLGPLTFFMALTESLAAKATKTTAYLLSIHRFNELQLVRPLRNAASNGMVKEVELLIAHGADVNAYCDGETALMVSAAKGNKAVVEKLLSLGAQTQLLSQRSGLTAYGIAEKMGRHSTLRIKALKPPKVDGLQVVISSIAPYVSAALAITGAFLFLRAFGIFKSRTLPVPQAAQQAVRRANQQGLVLRLVRDPRSDAVRPAAAPAQNPPFPALALALAMAGQRRQAMDLMMAPFLAAMLAQQDNARLFDRIEAFQTKMLQALLAAAQLKLEQQPKAAPAA